MRVFQKLFNRSKQSDGSYKLSSFWTAADTVEMDNGNTLENQVKSINENIDKKGDKLFYDSQTHMLYLLSGENRIDGVEIVTGGTEEILGDVSGVSLIPDETSMTLKWTDPADGENIQWGGTTVIRKQGSRPVDCLDGTVVVDTTTRNQYSTNGFVDTNLTQNTEYWYRFFPYTTEGQIRTGLAICGKTTSSEGMIGDYPTVSGTYTYNGQEQTVVLNDYDADKMTILSGNTGMAAGDYNVVISPKTGYCWADNTTDEISLTWSIKKASIAYIPTQSGSIEYSGNSKTPSFANYNEDSLRTSGDTTGTDAGTYTITFTPKENYQWSDGTITGKNVQWTIQRAIIQNVPTPKETLNYTGSEISPRWNNYDPAKLTIGGTTSAINEGDYYATFTPTINYKWGDETTTAKEVMWSIANNYISITPSQHGTLAYSGEEQSPQWDNYDSNKLTLSGETVGTNAQTYQATFTPKEGYVWYNNGVTSDAPITVEWVIDRAYINNYPAPTGTLEYTGSQQSPTWEYYDSNKMTISGTTNATDAGTYTAMFTPTSNYKWGTGSTSSRNVNWTIYKANGSLTLSSNSVSFSSTGATEIITVSNNTGDVSVLSSDQSVATASISGNTITITCVGSGNATINVTAATSTNYYSASRSINVTASVNIRRAWGEKNWTGDSSIYGKNIFKYGSDIYCLNGDFACYKLINQTTGEWESYNWPGFRNITGEYIWTDGDNAYYSRQGSGWEIQKVLNKETNTWDDMIWNGAEGLSADCIWKVGDNTYFSNYNEHYVLNRETNTWIQKTWNGLTEFYSSCIWIDGDNVYYSYGTDHYILNKSTSTWETKTWNGSAEIYGSNIWTDGENIFYSGGSEEKQYILDKATNTWIPQVWDNYSNIYGSQIWSDNEGNIYYSRGSQQYYYYCY